MIDFNQMNLDWPFRRIGKNHDVCRAVGLNKFSDLTILDATTGLGRDAFIFAKLGAKVTMLERHPTLIALLQSALDDFQDALLKQNLSFMPNEAADYLKICNLRYDIIYLDPMFSEIDKRSKVKKDMQFLQTLVGDDNDADQLLELALTKARKRVVVKRHKLSSFLANQAPHHQIIGKSTRYDVYLPA